VIVPRFGIPAEVAEWGALVLGAATLVWGARAAVIARRYEPRVVAGLALIAGILSAIYVDAYLRGGPRIIDATSYWLEARALSQGHVSWPVGEPEASSLGRFLVRSEDAGGARAAVLFPPGYPLLLALGFLTRTPMLVGPLLAAALVLATWGLAREVVGEDETLAGVPLVAAALSVVCGALRYHTADTMSHGLAALCFALGTTFVLRAGAGDRSGAGDGSDTKGAGDGSDTKGAGAGDRSGARRTAWAALGGLFGGWLFATRPASGLAWAALVVVILATWRGRTPSLGRTRGLPLVRLAAAVLAGALPFAIVLLLHQRLATGAWLVSTHAAHYAANDGPGGCFRYGFGAGIGCYGEHGDFVRANLPDGFGLVAAVKTTARRLWMHLVDAGNAEPLALLVPAGAALAWRRPRVRLLAFAVLLQIAAYVPFYFDGNYPGGGARLYADVLPVEHVLLAIAAVALAARPGKLAALAKGSGAWLVGLALLGFALRAGHDHAQLRDRDGGAPLFSAHDLRAAGITTGLVLVDGDAAYNLAFDPDARAATGIEVVRFKGDVLDTMAWMARGTPPAFLHRFEVAPGSGRGHGILREHRVPRLWPMAVEGESLWPARAQQGGAFALPIHASGTCASGGRALRVLRGDAAGGAVHVGLPAGFVQGEALAITVLARRNPADADCQSPLAEVSVVVDGHTLARQSIVVPCGPAAQAPTCVKMSEVIVPDGARRADVVLAPQWSDRGDPELQPLLGLDHILIRPAPRSFRDEGD